MIFNLKTIQAALFLALQSVDLGELILIHPKPANLMYKNSFLHYSEAGLWSFNVYSGKDSYETNKDNSKFRIAAKYDCSPTIDAYSGNTPQCEVHSEHDIATYDLGNRFEIRIGHSSHTTKFPISHTLLANKWAFSMSYIKHHRHSITPSTPENQWKICALQRLLNVNNRHVADADVFQVLVVFAVQPLRTAQVQSLRHTMTCIPVSFHLHCINLITAVT